LASKAGGAERWQKALAPVETFFEIQGPSIIDALQFSPLERIQKLYAALQLPQNSGKLLQLCKKHEVTLADLVECVAEYHRATGIMASAPHLSQVMVDVAIDAQSTMAACARCDGLGRVKGEDTESRKCPECDGSGKVRKAGNKDARELLYESFGLRGRSKAPTVAIQQNFGGVLPFEQNAATVQKLLSED
jgi:hypothetical protein